jgi:mannose-6-phosphate isomerase-like protein (cupin superfamily)
MLTIAVCVLAISISSPALAQKPTVKVYTHNQLLQMEQQLRDKQDKSKGLASQTLDTNEIRKTILVTRDKDGQAEMHAKASDFFVVVEGNATLVFGGRMLNPKSLQNGESLGDSVKGGTSIKLGRGDIVQIPPNIPHQLLIQTGKTFTYFILKLQMHS